MNIYSILILTNPISKFKNSKIQNINGKVVLIGDVSNMFRNARYFSSDNNSSFSVSDWDATKVTDMSCMFKFATRFDSDISKWNIANVTNMNYMFYEAKVIASYLSGWNKANVKYMRFMFNGVEKFNSDVNSNLKIRCWNTSKVISISYMFS
jgi:surface protein